jgi:hypothetical protein
VFSGIGSRTAASFPSTPGFSLAEDSEQLIGAKDAAAALRGAATSVAEFADKVEAGEAKRDELDQTVAEIVARNGDISVRGRAHDEVREGGTSYWLTSASA